MIGWPLIPRMESSGGFAFPASAREASRLFSCRRFPHFSEWRMAVVLLEVRDGCTCVCAGRADLWPQLTCRGIKTLLWQQEHRFSCLSFTPEWRVSRKRLLFRAERLWMRSLVSLAYSVSLTAAGSLRSPTRGVLAFHHFYTRLHCFIKYQEVKRLF